MRGAHVLDEEGTPSQLLPSILNWGKSIRRRVKHLVMFGALIGLGSCSQPNRSELCGKYLATYPYGTETLILEKNGTFFQQYHPTKGDLISKNGIWRYDKGDDEVVLTNPIFVDDQQGEPNSKEDMIKAGVWGLTAHRGLFSIQLVINEDLGFYFTQNVR